MSETLLQSEPTTDKLSTATVQGPAAEVGSQVEPRKRRFIEAFFLEARDDGGETEDAEDDDDASSLDDDMSWAPRVSAGDVAAIAAVIAEHAQRSTAEMAAFAGLKTFTDVLYIFDPKQRARAIDGMKKAVAAIADRRDRLSKALQPYAPGTLAQPNATIDAGWRLRDTIADHIPFTDLTDTYAWAPSVSSEDVAGIEAIIAEHDRLKEEESQAYKGVDSMNEALGATNNAGARKAIEAISARRQRLFKFLQPYPPGRPSQNATIEAGWKLYGTMLDGLPYTLPDTDRAAVPEDVIATVRAIIEEHHSQRKIESKAFAEVTSVDDAARINEPKERKEKLEGMKAALEAIGDRRSRLNAALQPYKPANLAQPDATITEGWNCLSTMYDHLPTAFQDGGIRKSFEIRYTTLTASDADKKQIRADAMAGFKDASGQDSSQLVGQVFRDVINAVGTKPMERQSFYFDQFISTPPTEKLAQINAINEQLVNNAQQIIDAGGKLRDVEVMLAKCGVPKNWWPPQFIEAMQAWRMTERAMLEERVAKNFQKQSIDLSQVNDVTNFVMGSLPELAEGVTDALNLVMKDPDVASAMAGFVAALNGIKGLGEAEYKALMAGDFNTVAGTAQQATIVALKESLDILSAAVNNAVGTLKGIDHATALAGAATALATVVPGLSAVACGIETAVAVKGLVEDSVKSVQTRLMEKDSQRALGDGSLEDGGAFLKALDNECHARNKKIIEGAIDVGQNVANLTGAVAGAAGGHYGLAAQGTIKVLNCGVSVGKKIVFTSINWGEARRAKALLKEAQAGNPQARMEIFKNSNLYAKMYICLLAYEGNPLATKFLVQRGIEESDLDEAMSLNIIRDALLESGGQKDERNVEDNLALEFVPKSVKSGAAFIGKKTAALAKKGYDAATGNNKPYDAEWKWTGSVELTEADWDFVKKKAKDEAGLYDEDTGIGKALANVAASLPAAQALVNAGKNKLDKGKKEENQATLLAAISALNTAYDCVFSNAPLSTPTGTPPKQEPHQGMVLYQGMLCDKIREERIALEKFLQDSKLQDLGFDPKPPPGRLLDAATWVETWNEGVKQACLPADNSGLEKYLAAAAEAKEAHEKARRDRALSQKYRTALKDVMSACEAARREAVTVPGIVSYIQKIVAEAAAASKNLDDELSATGWTPQIPPSATQITADVWDKIWKEADAEGYVSWRAGDGGVRTAIATLEQCEANLPLAAEGKDRAVAAAKYAKAAGGLRMAKAKFEQKQPDVSKLLTSMIEDAIKLADQTIADWHTKRKNITFKASPAQLKSASWKETYNAGVEAGAIAPSKGRAKTLEQALKSFESESDNLLVAVDAEKFEEARKLAAIVVAHLDEIIKGIEEIDANLNSEDSYRRNAQMKTYLDSLLGKAEEQRKSGLAAFVVGGNTTVIGADAFKSPGFKLDSPNFTEVKKEAVALGVIPKTDTGMRAALRARDEAAAKLIACSPNDVKKHAEAEQKALAACDTLLLKAAELKKPAWSTNTEWLEYIDQIVKEVDDYRAEIFAAKAVV